MKTIRYGSLIVAIVAMVLVGLSSQVSPIYFMVSIIGLATYVITIPKDKRNQKLGKTKASYVIVRYATLFFMCAFAVIVIRNDYDRTTFKLVEVILAIVYLLCTIKEHLYRVNAGKETEIESNKQKETNICKGKE